jgi:hypothetical protein
MFARLKACPGFWTLPREDSILPFGKSAGFDSKCAGRNASIALMLVCSLVVSKGNALAPRSHSALACTLLLVIADREKVLLTESPRGGAPIEPQSPRGCHSK